MLLDNVLAERRSRTATGFITHPDAVAVSHYVGVLAPGTRVEGQDPFTIEGLTDRLTEIADQVEQVVGHLNTILGDPDLQANISQTLRNVEATSAVARRAAEHVEQATRRFGTLVDRDVAAVAADLRRMSRVLVQTAEELQGFLREATGDGSLARDVRETARAVRQAGERVEQMAADLQGLASPENVGRAQKTLDAAHETVQEAREVVRRAADRLQPSRIDAQAGLVNGAPAEVIIPDSDDRVPQSLNPTECGRQSAPGTVRSCASLMFGTSRPRSANMSAKPGAANVIRTTAEIELPPTSSIATPVTK